MRSSAHHGAGGLQGREFTQQTQTTLGGRSLFTVGLQDQPNQVVLTASADVQKGTAMSQ